MQNVWQKNTKQLHYHGMETNPLLNSDASTIEEMNLKELRQLEDHHERRMEKLCSYIHKLEDRIALLEERQALEIRKKTVRRLLKIKRGAAPSHVLSFIADPGV